MADRETLIPKSTNGKNTAVDPTRNVLDLVEAAVRRTDDLADAETKRIDDRFALEGSHVRELMSLRAEYTEKLTVAEAKRIDAIRAVDVNAVSVASERATQQASVLATQVSTSAETLRALVASSAATTATQLTQIITPITDRIALLEKAQYEGTGKSGVTDPIFNKLSEKLDSLSLARSEGIGKGIGSRELIAYLLAVGSIVVVILSRFIK